MAHGDADEQSDVDFLVEFDLDRSLFDHAALLFDLQELLGCPVDVVNEGGLKPRLCSRALTEAVPL
jgi:predicted nucleotidyltransferase